MRGRGREGSERPRNDANALVAPDADGDTVGAAGFGFEKVPPDVGVPKLGRG
jgi:hypothetical protein